MGMGHTVHGDGIIFLTLHVDANALDPFILEKEEERIPFFFYMHILDMFSSLCLYNTKVDKIDKFIGKINQ